jgi:hypothetical protein
LLHERFCACTRTRTHTTHTKTFFYAFLHDRALPFHTTS